MCLIKFSELSESFEAMSILHGREVFGRKMFISFTRSKIWWKLTKFLFFMNSLKTAKFFKIIKKEVFNYKIYFLIWW